MTVIIFLIVLALLVLVHELGHFLVAKWSRVRVDEFGIGFPPRAIAWKPERGETTYSLNWIPFGGFVKIFGEDPTIPDEERGDMSRNMTHRPWWVQIGILAGGVCFNILFAWILFSFAFMTGFPTSVTRGEAGLVGEPDLTVLGVFKDSPAQRAGLKSGDVILFAERNGKSIQNDTLSIDTFQALIAATGTDPVTLFIKRNDVRETVVVTPTKLNNEALPAVGVYLDTLGTIQLPWYNAVWKSATMTASLTKDVAVGIVSFIGNAFTGKANLSDVTGPVGLAGLVGDASRLGFIYLLSFVAFISINLAVINLVPFPALDGGRILFVIIERIKGSPIRPAIAQYANLIGFALLLILMGVVTYHDIARLFG